MFNWLSFWQVPQLNCPFHWLSNLRTSEPVYITSYKNTMPDLRSVIFLPCPPAFSWQRAGWDEAITTQISKQTQPSVHLKGPKWSVLSFSKHTTVCCNEAPWVIMPATPEGSWQVKKSTHFPKPPVCVEVRGLRKRVVLSVEKHS